MSFPPTAFFDHPDECDNIRRRLPPLAPDFESFVVHGTMENPVQIDLYRNRRPAYNEHQIATYVRDGIGFVRRT